MKINRLLAGSALIGSLALGSMAQADEISTKMAKMQAMDKITGMVRVINVPVNSEVKFGTFSILVRACKTRPPEETPENFAFVDIVDNYGQADKENIFRGWMISSSPALNAVAHPIYDVWLLKCIDGEIPGLKYMTEEELKARETIPQSEKAKAAREYADLATLPGEKKAEQAQPSLPETKEAASVAPVETPPAEAVNVVADEKLTAKNVTESDNDLPDLADNNVEAEMQPQESGAPKSLINIAPEETSAAAPEQPAPVNVPADLTQESVADVLPSEEPQNQAEAEVVIKNETPVEADKLGTNDDMTLEAEIKEAPAPTIVEPSASEPAAVQAQPAEDEEIEENGMLEEQLIDFSN